MNRPIRIANFSGAAGDYFDALHDAVHGDPVDVLVGDYLAEIAYGLVLQRAVEANNPKVQQEFSFDIFLRQVTPELGAIAEKSLKVVTNAGAFNPEGMAARLRDAIAKAGVDLKVATVSGDDLLPRVQELAAVGQLASLDTGKPLGNHSGRIIAANAYLGGWGIAEALAGGADIVIAGRVTDASLTMGPAAWWHGWSKSDWDAVAGGIAAGHILECGPQASGGNYSGFRDLGGDVIRLGFPIGEIEADGSFTITKQSRSRGFVTPDTVKAQLLYEIQGPRYLNPDAVLHIDSLDIAQDGEDRVRVSGIKGSPPPATTKVGCFYQDGWRFVMIVYVTGLDWHEKVEWIRSQMRSITEPLKLDEFHFEPLGRPIEAPANQGEATMVVRIAAAAQELEQIEKLGAGFATLGLGSIPGFTGEFGHLIAPRMEYWPGLALQRECMHQVTLEDGSTVTVELPETDPEAATSGEPAVARPFDPARFGETKAVPLGEIIHARSGDKGGDASLGVWCKSPEAYDWLTAYLTGKRVHAMMGLKEEVTVDAFSLPNIAGQLYVLRGHFGRSGTSNIALDQIGKGLGEFLRACVADIPVSLLEKSREPVS